MIEVKNKDLVKMCVLGFGEWNGSQFELFLDLPSCFSKNLDFQNSCGCNADFLRLTINDKADVEVWFIDEDEDTFYYSLEEVMELQPLLYTSIVTCVYGMVLDLKEDC